MADTQSAQLRPEFIDKRRSYDKGVPILAENANYGSIASMRTRLTALAPGTYTTSRLNTMTTNDMVYALRLLSADAAGI